MSQYARKLVYSVSIGNGYTYLRYDVINEEGDRCSEIDGPDNYHYRGTNSEAYHVLSGIETFARQLGMIITHHPLAN